MIAERAADLIRFGELYEPDDAQQQQQQQKQQYSEYENTNLNYDYHDNYADGQQQWEASEQTNFLLGRGQLKEVRDTQSIGDDQQPPKLEP